MGRIFLPKAILGPLMRWLTPTGKIAPQHSRGRRHLRATMECLEGRDLLDGSGILGSLSVQLKSGAALPADHWGLTADAVQATPLPGWYEVTGPNLQEALQRLQADPLVAQAALTSKMSVTATPNDPRYVDNTLWYLNGANGIGASAAWDINTGSTNVAVGIIDTGIDVTHPDLYKNIWINQGEIPASIKSAIKALPDWDVDGDGLITFWDLNDPRDQGPGKITDLDADGKITAKDILFATSQGGWANGVSDDGDSYIDDLVGWNFVANNNKPFDDMYHGTHVSGTIGAIGNNGTGVVGINWKTQLMAVKVLDAGGAGDDVTGGTGILYAADHGARVSNVSWAGDGDSPFLEAAIASAAAKNNLVVAGVGNAGISTDISPVWPASLPNDNIIAVAATDDTGGRWNFSNYGAVSVDIGAPGVNIFSTILNGQYASQDGTSLSTPQVTGAVALILSQAPSLSALQVKDLILSRTIPNPTLAGRSSSGGNLNLGGIFTNGPEIQVAVGAVQLADNISAIDFGASTIGAPITKTLVVSNVGIVPLTLGTPALPSGFTLVSGPIAASLAPGQTASYVVRMTADAKGTFAGQLTLTNNDASEGLFRVTLRGVVANRAPVVGALVDQSMPFIQGAFTVILSAGDPDGDPLTLSATAVSQAYYYRQRFGLYTTGNLHFDFAGRQEKWLYGNLGSSYFILPTGDLYQYIGPAVGDGTFVANVGVSAYQDPSLLYNAAPLIATTKVIGRILKVYPAASFVGKLVVTATASDGALSDSQSFTLTVTNAPPIVATIADQSILASQRILNVPFSASDPEGQPLSFTATVATEAYNLKQQFGLFLNGSLFTNTFGRQEKWLYGNGGRAFFILPNGFFYQWNGTAGVATGTFLAAFDKKYYDDPSLLYNAVNDGGSVLVSGGQIEVTHAANFIGKLIVTLTANDGVNSTSASFKVSVNNQPPILAAIADQTMASPRKGLKIALSATDPDQQTLTYSATVVPLTYYIKQRFGLFAKSSYNDNLLGLQEKWIYGDNGTSFYILPTGALYQWIGVATAANLVATFDNSIYQNPTLLTNAVNSGVLSIVVGKRLTILPDAGFRGKLFVTANVSDGWASDARSFVITVT